MDLQNENTDNLLKLYDQITDFIKFLEKEKNEMEDKK